MFINDEITYDTVMKSSSVGVGGSWVASATPKVLICWKAGQKWRPTLFDVKKWREVCIKTQEDLFLEVAPKRGLHNLCGRKFVGKSCTINFSGKFGEIRAKSFAPPKCACSYTCDEKAPSLPLPFFWKGRGENALAMPPFSGIPLHIILHAISLLVVVSQCFSTFFASRTTLCNKKFLGNTKQNFIITIMMFSSVLALLIY